MLRGGINPIVTVLDCSKAFDKCKFSHLFRRLLDKGLPAVVVRVLVLSTWSSMPGLGGERQSPAS